MVSIVAFSFHPAFYPPKSGGEQRLYYIYKNMSLINKITLITFTYPHEKNEISIVFHNENFKEIRIPKTAITKYIYYIINKLTPIVECSAVVASLESRFNKNFQITSLNEIKKCDIIVFVYPYLFTIDKELLKNKKVIYEAHNFEYELMKQSLGVSLLGKLLIRYVFHMECSLCKNSDKIFAVSQENRIKLASVYDINKTKIIISPNGININDYEGRITRVPSEKKKCVFIGSFHPPNIDAIDKIITIAKQMPDICFVIAGSASQYYVNCNDNLFEQMEIQDINGTNFIKPLVLSGFYNVEYWDSIPTVWSKPTFKIWVSKLVCSIKLRLYSACHQEIAIKIRDKTKYYDINEGFNEIQILLEDKSDRLLDFLCEKHQTDDKRTLGVAVQKITFMKGNEENHLDISHQMQLPFTAKDARNVVMLGQLSDKEKLELYSSSDVALNPMESGSGTNIKMLDYMAAYLPVVSTHTGSRGLDIENYTHAIVCDLNDFPRAIREILGDEQLRNRLIYNGRKLVVEKYDWSKIAKDMGQILRMELV